MTMKNYYESGTETQEPVNTEEHEHELNRNIFINMNRNRNMIINSGMTLVSTHLEMSKITIITDHAMGMFAMQWVCSLCNISSAFGIQQPTRVGAHL